MVITAIIVAALYFYAFTTLKQQTEQQGEAKGFKLFIDGIVVDEFKINPSIKFTQLYLHGFPWELLQDKPEYISAVQADIDADHLLTAPIKWPFTAQSIDIPVLKIHKTILGKQVDFSGSAKQTPETPILLDFTNDDENHALSGKTEIRIENGQVQMIDTEFDEADIDFPLLGTKRGSGWLSLSYEDGWQIVGELDAGITLLGPYQFFDSTVKLTGPVAQEEMTFSGQLDQQTIIINQREGNYFVQQGDQTLPVAPNDNPLQEIVSTLDKVKQSQIAAEEAAKLAQKQAEEEQKKKTAKKKEEKKKQETPPPSALKIEPVTLPETSFDTVTTGTSLAGFIYKQPLVQVKQPCGPNIAGECWEAHAQGGQFSYNPEALPKYFLQLKDYEQVKQLKSALLDFNIQTMVVQGKDKTAQKIILKGTTTQNQPAEIQLSVLGLE
jgi:hypothetical protein